MDPGSIPGGCVLQPGGGTQRLRFPEGASCSPGVAHSWLECLCVVRLSLPMSCCYVSYLCLLLDIASNYFTVAFFHCQSCAFRTSKPHYCQHTGFRGFLWVGSSCWEEVTLFHCKSCAFIRSKPRYCQTHWFQRFFVGWLIMLGRGVSLSLQELCFQ